MRKCLLCKKSTRRPLYCSSKCIKRGWYLRHNPNKKSFGRDKEFWNTATGIGFRWEKYAAKLLKATHLKFNSKGADLNWNGKMVDVKVANLWRRKFKRGKSVKSKQSGYWVFHCANKIWPDFFFCIALYKGKPLKKLLIPANKVSKSGVVIGWKSIYDKYLYMA